MCSKQVQAYTTNAKNAKLIVLLYHYNSNTSTFKFYSATTKYEAPTRFGSFYRFGGNAPFGNAPFGADKPTTSANSLGSFRTIYGFGDDAPFGAVADKPTTSAESQNMPTDGPILDYGDYNYSDSSNEFREEATAGFDSFRPIYGFGYHTPFGVRADKPTHKVND